MATSPTKAPYRDIKVGKDTYRVYPDGSMKNLTPNAPKVAAAKPTTPALAGAITAAAPQKRIDPFSTGAEIQNAAQFLGNAASQTAGIDQSLAEEEAAALQQLGYTDANGVHHAGSIDKGALQSSDGVNNSTASRGLGRSSIRDGALYDIEAQRVIQTGFLKDRIKRAQTNATTNKGIIAGTVHDFNAGLVAQQAANAVMLNNTIEPPAAAVTPAAPAAAQPAAAAKTPASSAKPVVTTRLGQKPIYSSAAWAGAVRAATKKTQLGSGIGGK